MDPKLAAQWLGILRDTVIVLVGAFLLVYEAVWAKEADWQIIAAALTCFGLPPVLRLDIRNGKKTEEGD